jgi:DNA-binding CsgD family transcriptional regulator
MNTAHFPPENSYHEPRNTAFDFMPQLLGTSVLFLSLAIYKVGLIYYLLRGLPKAHQVTGYTVFSVCVVATALALPFLEKRVAGSKAWAALFFLLLSAAAFCTTFMYFFVGIEGRPLINTIQVGLWGVPIPVGLRLFFRHVPPRSQPLCFALALGIAYLITAILVPLFNGLDVLSAEQAKNWLPLLHLFRNGSALIMAALALRLIRGYSSAYPEVHRNAAADESTPSRRLLLLLVPVMLCFFLRGFLFHDQIVLTARSGEMTHLITGFLFLAFGFAATREEHFLQYLLCANFLVSALISTFLAFSEPSYSLRLLGDANDRLLLFSGTLVAGRLAGFFRYPALVCASVFLIFGLLFSGRLAGFGPHSLFFAYWSPSLCLLAALCVGSISLLRRIFPLPMPPVPDTTPNELKKSVEADLALQTDSPVKRLAYIAAFSLTKRESDVLDGLLRGVKSASLAEELQISGLTVKFHLKNILQKTGAENRRKLLAAYAAWRHDEYGE